MLRQLAEQDPAHLPDLVRVHSVVSDQLQAAGRHRESARMLLFAAASAFKLWQTQPEGDFADLVRIGRLVVELGLRWSQAGDHDKALAATNRAVRLLAYLRAESSVVAHAQLSYAQVRLTAGAELDLALSAADEVLRATGDNPVVAALREHANSLHTAITAALDTPVTCLDHPPTGL